KGQLGLNDVNNRNNPILIPNLNQIIQISAGHHHSLVLSNNGHVYAFGYNDVDQLGLKDIIGIVTPTLIPNLNQIIQISAGHSHSLALSNTGQIYAFGNNGYGQLGLGNYNNEGDPVELMSI